MFRNVVTAEEQTTLSELAETMVKRGITVIPILREGRVVGVVTRGDLVATIAREPAMLR
jgi:CBS domain-containing protein